MLKGAPVGTEVRPDERAEGTCAGSGAAAEVTTGCDLSRDLLRRCVSPMSFSRAVQCLRDCGEETCQAARIVAVMRARFLWKRRARLAVLHIDGVPQVLQRNPVAGSRHCQQGGAHCRIANLPAGQRKAERN